MATMKALKMLRSADEIAETRGVDIGRKTSKPTPELVNA
jgi:hypothetical protein